MKQECFDWNALITRIWHTRRLARTTQGHRRVVRREQKVFPLQQVRSFAQSFPVTGVGFLLDCKPLLHDDRS
jgi:hypothetical protein